MKSIDIKSLLIGVLISFFGGFLPFVAANNYLSVGRYELSYNMRMGAIELGGDLEPYEYKEYVLFDTKDGKIYKRPKKEWELIVSSPTD